MRLMKDIRLLAISDRFPHSKDSISLSFVKNQIDSLKNLVGKIYVIALTPYVPRVLSSFPFMNPRWKRDIFACDYRYENVEVHFAKHLTFPFDFSRKMRGEIAFKKIDRIIADEKINFDLIYSNFTYPSGYVGAKLKEKYKKELVVRGGGYDVYDLPFKDPQWRSKIDFVLASSDHMITPSQSLKRDLIRLGLPAERVSVIPNGHNPESFKIISTNGAREKLGLPKDKRIILSVGHLEAVKGHKYLIQSMERLVRMNLNAICCIVGDGSQRRNLENSINKLNLMEGVKLVGAKPYNEIPLWMNACDIFVHPSINEGNPNVMLEAMGCGKPLVGTKVGGIPEIIIENKLGILVDPGDPEGLAKAMAQALDTSWDKEYISKCAGQFTWNNTAQRLIEVFNEVLAKK
jgi:glycosyltransferase involved in cell wall biosynthesis